MGFGAPRSYHKRFSFEVEIDGIGSAGFMSCSGLSAEVETIEIHEGGGLKPSSKDPGKVSFPPITLRRGVTTDLDTYAWFLTVAEGTSGLGLPDPLFRRGVSINQLNRAGAVIRQWDLVDAWIKKIQVGDWDSNSNEANVEEIVIEMDHWLLSE